MYTPPPAALLPRARRLVQFFELFSKHVETVDGAFEAAFKEAKASAPKGERNAYMQLLYVAAPATRASPYVRIPPRAHARARARKRPPRTSHRVLPCRVLLCSMQRRFPEINARAQEAVG
ncbi:hypothetical protein EON62_06500, partial [archaeon]